MLKFQISEFVNSYEESVVLQGSAYTYRIAPENFISFILTNKKLVWVTANGANVKIMPVSSISGIRTSVGNANSFAVYVTDKSAKYDMEFLFPATMDGSMAQKTLVMAISSLLK